MALGDFFLGTPAQTKQQPLLSPQQQGLKSAVSNQALGMLQGLGNQFNFAPIAEQARTQFQTQTVPGLAERFTSLGGGGQRSSAFQGALGQAGAGLEQGLAALQSQYGLQQQGLQQQLLQSLLGHAFEPEVATIQEEATPGILSKILEALPMIAGAYFGGPAGAAAGSTLGSTLFGKSPQTGSSSQIQNALMALRNLLPQKQAFGSRATNAFPVPQYESLIGSRLAQPTPATNVLGQANPQFNIPNYQSLIQNTLGIR